MYNILITIPMKEIHLDRLKAVCPDASYTIVSPREVTTEMAHSADIILGNVSPALIKGSEKLKWMQLNSAGTDGYTTPGVLPEGCLLTNATGAYGLAISEHMLAMLLTLMKRLNQYGDDQKTHTWSDRGPVNSIDGAKTLVVGCGDIGCDFARKMNALGSSVTGIRRTVQEKPDYLDAQYQMDALKTLLPEADIVAAALPGTKETYKIFNEETFGLMKEGAIFLNVGRGTAVDSDALAAALNSGHLFGAGIDVTDPEPLPTEHPLWDAENILITPHISGNYHLNETLERIRRIATENLGHFLNGEPLKNIVDFETGYRRA